jgi:protoheme ferro-lyase
MLRTSRCFGGIFLQLGGPEALLGAERYLCEFHFADFSSARITLSYLTKFLFTTRARKVERRDAAIAGNSAHNPKGNPAAQFAAIIG